MNTPQQHLKQILELQAAATQFTDEGKNKAGEAGKEVAQLRERILAGETTGDRLTDFVLVRYSTISPDFVNIYRSLQSRMEGHVGELVLVAVTEQERLRHEARGMFRGYRGNYFERKRFYLGVLTGDTLLIEGSNSCIPTATHVSCYDTSRHDVEKQSGNIPLQGGMIFPADLALHLDASLNHLGEVPGRRVEIKIGDTAVAEWFEKTDPLALHLLRKASRLLGHTIPESPLMVIQVRQQAEAMTQRIRELDKACHTCKWDLETATRSNASNRHTQRDTAREALKSAESALKTALSHAVDEGFVNKTYDPNDTIRNLCIEHDIALPNEV